MRLIAVLIALALDRFLNIGTGFRNFSWVNTYAGLLEKNLSKTFVWRSWSALVIIILPIIIAVAVIVGLAGAIFYEVAALVVSIVILIYCLGPVGLHQQFKQYVNLLEEDKQDEAQEIAEEILGKNCPKEKGERNQKLAHAMVTEINRRLFAVLFWFIILGAVGAVLYRVVAVINESAKSQDSLLHGLLTEFQVLLNILDWVPARLVALTYALAGNFDATMKCLLRTVWGGLASSGTLLTDCGKAALGDSDSEQSERQILMVMDLIDRALFIWLIIYALAVVAVWVF